MPLLVHSHFNHPRRLRTAGVKGPAKLILNGTSQLGQTFLFVPPSDLTRIKICWEECLSRFTKARRRLLKRCDTDSTPKADFWFGVRVLAMAVAVKPESLEVLCFGGHARISWRMFSPQSMHRACHVLSLSSICHLFSLHALHQSCAGLKVCKLFVQNLPTKFDNVP